MANDLLHSVDPNCNAVVHAAAGTGKTWLLTSRIVRLLLAGADPGGILAITFTRKAAQEMTERVHHRLLQMAVAPEPGLAELINEIGLAPEPATCHAARTLYERLLTTVHSLRTTTFHAFCQDLLRRFALEAGVPPGFEVIEDIAVLRQQAWSALTRELTHSPPGVMPDAMDELIRTCGSLEATRAALYSFLDHRSDWWAYTETDSDPLPNAIDRVIRLFASTADDPLSALLASAEFRTLCRQFIALAGIDPIPSLAGRVQAAEQALNDAGKAERTWDALTSAFLINNGGRRALGKRAAKRTGPDGQTLGDVSDRLCDAIEDARAARAAAQACTANIAWYRCAAALLDHFQRLKRERNQLDFADLEWQAYRLLARSAHAEWVQYKLDRRIDHLLIDEFQDTNPTQWRLVLPLLEELAAGDPQRHRSVFLVGDDKQSIYRFRRADARLFRQAHDWLVRQTGAETHTQDMSWRSSPAITVFVNVLFSDPAPISDSGAEATVSTRYALSEFRPHSAHYDARPGHVEVRPLFRHAAGPATAARAGFRNPLTTPREHDEDRRHHAEGTWIAGKIQEMISSGLAIEASDSDSVTHTRPLRYGDIFILLRDRTHAQAYEDALRAAGIAYLGTSRRQFQDALEVRDLINLLRVLIAPQDNLALAGVLRSPLFAVGDADLLALASEQRARPWWHRLEAIAQSSPADHAFARAWRLLSRWRTLADRVPVHDLLDRIFDEGNVLQRYLHAAPAQLRVRLQANLTRFIGRALDFDSGRYPSLPRFLRQVESERPDSEQTPADAALSVPGDYVRVLTIHGAKGLEAPVVFLADAARAGTDRPRVPWTLVDWPVEVPGPTRILLGGRRERLDQQAREVYDAQLAAARREEANLLYVAITRAKQMLFITGCAPGRGQNLGWYGFIDQRLRQPADVTCADGVAITRRPAGGEGLGEICASLRFGEMPRAPAEGIAAMQPAIVDPRLTRPFEAETQPRWHPPSALPDDPPAIPGAGTDTWRSARTRGIVVHRALELATSLTDRAQGLQRLRQDYGHAMPRRWLESCWQEALGVIDTPRLRELFDPACYREARNEVPLLFRSGSEQILGYIDRLVFTDLTVTVIDYKTNRVQAPAEIESLSAHYAPQMNRYAEGIARLWPNARVRPLLIFTALREAVEIPRAR